MARSDDAANDIPADVTPLPVLWSQWAPICDDGERKALCLWLFEQGIDPHRTRGVEIVVLDMPCVRVHQYEGEFAWQLDPATGDVLMRPPLLLPLTTPPPGYDPTKSAA